MTDTLLILAALVPMLAVPLAILSKCSGATFESDEEVSAAIAEIHDYIQRSIAGLYFVQLEALKPIEYEWPPVRQLEYFAVVVNFEMGEDK